VEEIEEIEKVLEEVIERKNEKTNRVNAAGKELEQLEGGKNEAMEFLKKEKEMYLLQNILNFLDLGDSLRGVNATVQKIENLRVEMRALRDDKRQKMEDNKDIVQTLNTDIMNQEKADKIIAKHKDEFQTIEQADIRIVNDKEHYQHRREKAIEHKKELEKQIKKLGEECKKLEVELPKKEQELAKQT